MRLKNLKTLKNSVRLCTFIMFLLQIWSSGDSSSKIVSPYAYADIMDKKKKKKMKIVEGSSFLFQGAETFPGEPPASGRNTYYFQISHFAPTSENVNPEIRFALGWGWEGVGANERNFEKSNVKRLENCQTVNILLNRSKLSVAISTKYEIAIQN